MWKARDSGKPFYWFELHNSVLGAERRENNQENS
jgi:hypothetical protein